MHHFFLEDQFLGFAGLDGDRTVSCEGTSTESGGRGAVRGGVVISALLIQDSILSLSIPCRIPLPAIFTGTVNRARGGGLAGLRYLGISYNLDMECRLSKSTSQAK